MATYLCKMQSPYTSLANAGYPFSFFPFLFLGQRNRRASIERRYPLPENCLLVVSQTLSLFPNWVPIMYYRNVDRDVVLLKRYKIMIESDKSEVIKEKRVC